MHWSVERLRVNRHTRVSLLFGTCIVHTCILGGPPSLMNEIFFSKSLQDCGHDPSKSNSYCSVVVIVIVTATVDM